MENLNKIIIVIVLIAPAIIMGTLCPEGQFKPSISSQCKSCSPCSRDMVVIRQCFNYTDNECGCQKGKWFRSNTQSCYTCTVAKVGQIFLKNCSTFEDAVVQYCPLGQFALNKMSCSTCNTCKGKKTVIQNCSISADTICKELKTDDEKTDYGLIIGVSVACVVIILVIGAVIYICCRRRKRDENENVTATANTSMNSLANIQYIEQPNQTAPKVTYNRVSSQMSNISLTVNPLSPDNGDVSAAVIPRSNGAATSGPSNHAVPRGVPQPAAAQGFDWQTTDLEHLDYNTRCSLAFLLTPTNLGIKNWRNIASSLKISNLEIMNLDGSQKPVLDMIELYGTKQGASIPGLYQAILDNGRNDVVKLFDKFKVLN